MNIKNNKHKLTKTKKQLSEAQLQQIKQSNTSHKQRSKEDILKLLTIARTHIVGANTMLYLLWKYENNIDDVINHLKQNKYRLPTEHQVEQEYTSTVDFGGCFLFPGDALFPNDIYSSCLIYKGNIELLNNSNRLAVIGSRNISPKGEILCRNFVQSWNNRDFVIVSGLAIGTDSIALSLADKPIGVLPCGLGVYYPLSNKKLQQTIESTGLVITEFAFGTQITKSSFPRRNSIIAAIAQQIAVIESTDYSGTISTVIRAEVIKKPIYVVPGHPSDSQYSGSNNMLRNDHIQMLLHPDDIVNKQNNHLRRKPGMFFATVDYDQVQKIHKLILNKNTRTKLIDYYSPAIINSALGALEALYHKNLQDNNNFQELYILS